MAFCQKFQVQQSPTQPHPTPVAGCCAGEEQSCPDADAFKRDVAAFFDRLTAETTATGKTHGADALADVMELVSLLSNLQAVAAGALMSLTAGLPRKLSLAAFARWRGCWCAC